MILLQKALILGVSLLHSYILYLEMFLWTKPQGRKVFRMSAEQAENTKVMAANQGIYNGFLAAGLLWAVLHPQAEVAFQLSLFFLGCVIVAAIYGAYSVGKKILYVQGVPAILALAATLLFRA